MSATQYVHPTGEAIDSGKIVSVDITGAGDFRTLAEAASYLRTFKGKRGGRVGMMGGQTHYVNTTIDLKGIKLIRIGGGRPIIEAQTGGLLQMSGNDIEGQIISVPIGFGGTYFMDIVENCTILFDKADLRPATGKFIFGCSGGPFTASIMFRDAGQSLQQGITVDPGAVFTSLTMTILGTSGAGSIQFGARPVTADQDGRYDTTGQITGLPEAMLTVAPGENIQSRLDSLAVVGGGILDVLSGVHLRTEPCYLIGNNIKMEGSGDGTIIRALAGTWNAAYTQGGTSGGGLPSRYQDAVVCIGRSHNGLPEVVVTGCEVQDLVVESSVSIHGFYIYGGEDNRFEGCTAKALAQLIYPGSWAAVGFMITDSFSLPAQRCVIDDCVVEATTSNWYCDAYHMEGGPPVGGFSGFYGNGNRVIDSSIIECSASSAFQTIYSMSKCDSCTCYICTGRDCPKDGTGNGITLGVFNCNKCAFIDVTGVNPAVATNIGAWIQDTILTDFIDCFICGNPTGPILFGSGIYVVNSQQNLIIQNVLERCTVGINITDVASTDNIIGPNTFYNVGTNIVDASGLNKFMVKAQYGTGNPNGVVTTKFGDEFFDSATSTWYKQSTYPQGTTWVVI